MAVPRWAQGPAGWALRVVSARQPGRCQPHSTPASLGGPPTHAPSRPALLPSHQQQETREGKQVFGAA